MSDKIKIKTIETKGDYANITTDDNKKIVVHVTKNEAIKNVKDGDEVELELSEYEKNGKKTIWGNYPKAKKPGFPVKDYTFEKKKVALECATRFCAARQEIKSDMIVSLANKLFEYLK